MSEAEPEREIERLEKVIQDSISLLDNAGVLRPTATLIQVLRILRKGIQ